MKEFSELQQRYTGFNRTFMELKCSAIYQNDIALDEVLIVPLWN